MRTEGSIAVQRRTVSWDPATRRLTVGQRSTTLGCDPGDNDCILRTYLALVAEQRHVPLDGSIVLRRDDIRVLAELLDLDDDALEGSLMSILRLSAPEAAHLRRQLLRHRVAFAAVGVSLLAGIPVTQSLAGADEAPTFERVTTVEAPAIDDVDAATTTPTVITVEAFVKVAPSPAPTVAATEPPAPEPAPPVEPEVEIGDAVTYERDPDYTPPEGVEIGDALVIERELPPDEG